MRAALDLIAAEGYGALTTAAVAAQAGASTASLYRRWPTKHALVADVARTLTRDALGDIDTGTLAGDLRELVGRKRALFARVGSVVLALLAEAGHDDELRLILRQEVLDETAGRLEAVLDRAVARGELPEPTQDLVPALSLAIVGGGLLRRALASTGSPETAAPVAGGEERLILRALGVS